ncbi:MAG: hypothetical protein ACLFTK_13800 [Anaerolineales bacterium]
MLLYQEDAEVLFPARLIPSLRDQRGPEFRALVDRVLSAEAPDAVEVLGFSFMMIQLASCLTCTADSYRAMNGCTLCAHKVIRGYKGTDSDLVALWEQACAQVRHWQQTGQAPPF